MKKYTVLEVNSLKKEALIIAEIEAENEIEARVKAFAKYNMYISISTNEWRNDTTYL